jgi:hypothetical protein
MHGSRMPAGKKAQRHSVGRDQGNGDRRVQDRNRVAASKRRRGHLWVFAALPEIAGSQVRKQ